MTKQLRKNQEDRLKRLIEAAAEFATDCTDGFLVTKADLRLSADELHSLIDISGAFAMKYGAIEEQE